MAEKSSSTIAIIVALIGVLGTIAAATIANWDKLFGHRDQNASVTQNAANGVPPEASSAVPAADPEIPVAVDVSGTWVDADGYQYLFEQKGTQYSFRQLKDGAEVGSGEGGLVGNSFNHKFTSAFGEGRCAGLVSGMGTIASGTCTNGPDTWDMRVVRSSTAKS